MWTSSIASRLSVAILVLSSIFAQLAAAVPLRIEADSEARKAGDGGNGFNLYLGTATWKDADAESLHGFNRVFAALAKDAFAVMRAQASHDNVPNPPRAMTVLLVGNKAYMSSSVSNVIRSTNQKPGDLLKMFQRPLYTLETVDGPTPDFGISTVLDVLGQCLKNVQTVGGRPRAAEHEMFCGEPVSMEQFYNDVQIGPEGAIGFRGRQARMITWGISANGVEGVFDPCVGGRISSPNAIGCNHLVNFVACPVVRGPINPESSYPQPDSANAATVCLSD